MIQSKLSGCVSSSLVKGGGVVCVIDWELFSAAVGAFASVGLLIVAIFGMYVWRTQFLRIRDHDIARRVLESISESEIVFHELRTPHGLITDSEEQVAPPNADDLPGAYHHRKIRSRYVARARHLNDVRLKRTSVLFEATSLWDNSAYALTLGAMINSLADLESDVMQEVTALIYSLDPSLEPVAGGAGEPNKEILYAPVDVEADDEIASNYEAIKIQILRHLRPKITMQR